MTWNLATEALAVGVALALALGLLVSRGVRITSFKTALAVGLVVGAALHVLFEMSGLNGAYCRMGHACRAG